MIRGAAAMRTSGLLLAVIAGWVPAEAAGQSCLGGPAEDNEFAVGIGATRVDEEVGGFLQGRANLEGPVAFASTLGVTEKGTDSNALVAAGTLALEFPGALSPCLVGGFGHVTWGDAAGDEEVDASLLTLPVGASAGLRISGPGGSELIPWSGAGLIYSRLRRSTDGGMGGATSASDAEIGVFFGGGATLQFGGLFLRAGVWGATVDEPGTTLSLELGWRWRRDALTGDGDE